MLRFRRGFSMRSICVVALAVGACMAASSASAQTAPDPGRLWDAYPLNPTGKQLPKTQIVTPITSAPRTSRRYGPAATSSLRPPSAEATAAIEARPDASDGPDLTLFALLGACGMVFVAVALLAVRRGRRARSVRPQTIPLWQGAVPLEAPSAPFRLRDATLEPPARTPLRPVARTVSPRRSTALATERRSRSRSLRRAIARVPARVRGAVWNERTLPLYIGSAMAIIVAVVIIHLVG